MSSQLHETLDRIDAMRRQEDRFYTVTTSDDDYLDDATFSNIIEWRSKMANYCYQITDFCSYKRETASIAISFLDRFVWSETTPQRKNNLRPMEALAKDTREAIHEHREVYQLLAIGCLYIAVKITEPEPLDPQTLSKLSHDTYTARQIEEMEAVIMEALRWHVHPPTAMAFVRELSDVCIATLLRHKDGKAIMMNTEIRKVFFDLTTRQTEIAMSEYNLVGAKASYVAYSSILNALQILSGSNALLRDIEFLLREALGITDAEQRHVMLNSSTEMRESLVVNKLGNEIDVVLQDCHCSSSSCSGSSTGSLMHLEEIRGSSSLHLLDVQDYLYERIIMEGESNQMSFGAEDKTETHKFKRNAWFRRYPSSPRSASCFK